MRAWLPRQHGAWAMLLVPLLLGVAATRPSPWHVVLAGAALSAYLASASAQAWARARRSPAYRAPIAVYGGLLSVLGIALVVVFPVLLLAVVLVGPAALVVLWGARPGTRRDLANSLAQVAQALVLVPAAAVVSGAFVAGPVATATAIAAGYLVGTVLVVRSVLRERGNAAFAGLSIGFHAVLVGLALVLLPVAYALLAAGLTMRAAALPVLQRRLAGGPRPLRPVQVGIVEIVASLAVVAVAFLAPP
jgi:hypothetical protein